MLLVPYVASSCRRMLPTAAHYLSLFIIFQLLWFTWLEVYHAFLSFCVPTDKYFLYMGVYHVSCLRRLLVKLVFLQVITSCNI